MEGGERRNGGGERAYCAFTPDVLCASPVQALDAASFHGNDVFSGRGVDYARPAGLAEEAV